MTPITFFPYIDVPRILASSRFDGMNIKLLRLAAADCAATEFAKLPVDAQPTVSYPSSTALERATATTLSLKDRDGKLTPSFLMYKFFTPRILARLFALISGV